MIAQERWVGDSDDDFPWCSDFNRRTWRRDGSWSTSWSFFLFFCNHAFIVFRYKKPHAALAMERTKPINQKHKQRKVTAPVNIHYRAGFSSAGPSASYNKESTN